MSLVEECQELAGRIDRLRSVKAGAEQKAELTTRRDQIELHLNALRPLRKTTVVFWAKAVPVAHRTAFPNRLSEELSRIRVAFEGNPGAIVPKANPQRSGASADLGGEIKFLTALTRNLTSDLTLAWKAYIDSFPVRQDTTVLQLLRAIPQYRDSVDRIERLQKDIDRYREKLPTSGADISQFVATVEKLKEHWQSLQSGPLSQSVVQFLSAAGGDGAAIGLLTPDVLAWMRQEGIETSFHVVIKRSA